MWAAMKGVAMPRVAWELSLGGSLGSPGAPRDGFKTGGGTRLGCIGVVLSAPGLSAEVWGWVIAGAVGACTPQQTKPSECLFPIPCSTCFVPKSDFCRRVQRVQGLPLPSPSVRGRIYFRGHSGAKWIQPNTARKPQAPVETSPSPFWVLPPRACAGMVFGRFLLLEQSKESLKTLHLAACHQETWWCGGMAEHQRL